VIPYTFAAWGDFHWVRRRAVTASAKVTSRGRVTIPQSVRKHLKVEAGSVVVFRVEGDRVVLRPAKTLLDDGGVLKGRGPKKLDMDTLRRSTRTHVARQVMDDER
jgi:AbrB family looped-hinge helix DNA binding protein